MAPLVVIAQTGLNAAAALVLASLAYTVLRHRREGDAGHALMRFGIWWGALAASVACTAVGIGATAILAAPPALAVALQYGALGLLSVAVWGFASYLGYVFTGRREVFFLADVAGAVQLVASVVFYSSLGPLGFEITPAGAVPAFGHEPTAGAAAAFAIAFLGVPLVASAALLRLRARAADPTTRWRTTALGAATTSWFLAGIVLAAAPNALASAITGPALSTLSACGIWMTYRPPAWLRSRGVAPFGEREKAAPQANVA